MLSRNSQILFTIAMIVTTALLIHDAASEGRPVEAALLSFSSSFFGFRLAFLLAYKND